MITNVKQMDSISETLLKGRITELKCELWFLENGYLVSIPDLPYQYDMIVDINGKLKKIQIKTSHYEEGGIVFNTSSVTHNNKGYTKRFYNENDVDYFMTYYENDYYLIPYNKAGKNTKKLRIEPTKNGQTKGIDFAKDFLAKKILQEEIIE